MYRKMSNTAYPVYYRKEALQKLRQETLCNLAYASMLIGFGLFIAIFC